MLSLGSHKEKILGPLPMNDRTVHDHALWGFNWELAEGLVACGVLDLSVLLVAARRAGDLCLRWATATLPCCINLESCKCPCSWRWWRRVRVLRHSQSERIGLPCLVQDIEVWVGTNHAATQLSHATAATECCTQEGERKLRVL